MGGIHVCIWQFPETGGLFSGCRYNKRPAVWRSTLGPLILETPIYLQEYSWIPIKLCRLLKDFVPACSACRKFVLFGLLRDKDGNVIGAWGFNFLAPTATQYSLGLYIARGISILRGIQHSGPKLNQACDMPKMMTMQNEYRTTHLQSFKP